MDNRYKFFIGKNTVVAVSSYAGKTVRGVAKCNPEDEFDEEKGKALAAARCNAKITKKRVDRANKKLAEASCALSKAEDRFFDMESYVADSECEYKNAEREVNEILKSML
ncbi:MAG: hypothetical protein LUC37_06540 [Prevotella sp.]|nr:hypothetical protein [Prevotella sp.]